MPVYTNMIGKSTELSNSNTKTKNGNNLSSILGHNIGINVVPLVERVGTGTVPSNNSYVDATISDDGRYLWVLYKTMAACYDLVSSSVNTLDLGTTYSGDDNFEYSCIIWFNGQVHILGGKPDSYTVDYARTLRHFVINSQGALEQKNNLPHQLTGVNRVCVHGGQLYYSPTEMLLDGNSNMPNTTIYSPQLYCYNPSSDSWNHVSSMSPTTGNIKSHEPVIIFSDGVNLFSAMNLSTNLFKSMIIYRYESNGTWVQYGTLPFEYINETKPCKFGLINGELYVVCTGTPILSNDNTGTVMYKRIGSKWYPVFTKEEIACNYICTIFGESLYYFINDSQGDNVFRCKLVDEITCPTGSTLVTNDTEVAKISTKTFTSSEVVRVRHKSDIYYTLYIGETVLAIESDIINHRVYGIAGTTINTTGIENTGLVTISGLDNIFVMY